MDGEGVSMVVWAKPTPRISHYTPHQGSFNTLPEKLDARVLGEIIPGVRDLGRGELPARS
jgi:hypothetical protein